MHAGHKKTPHYSGNTSCDQRRVYICSCNRLTTSHLVLRRCERNRQSDDRALRSTSKFHRLLFWQALLGPPLLHGGYRKPHPQRRSPAPFPISSNKRERERAKPRGLQSKACEVDGDDSALQFCDGSWKSARAGKGFWTLLLR
jgi:hypothetical protein